RAWRRSPTALPRPGDCAGGGCWPADRPTPSPRPRSSSRSPMCPSSAPYRCNVVVHGVVVIDRTVPLGEPDSHGDDDECDLQGPAEPGHEPAAVFFVTVLD